jgi:hypothetical protein
MKPDSSHEKHAHHASFEELKVLRDVAWASFTERREFEWRVALGLWTALAAFTSLILGKEVVLHGDAPIVCVVAVAVILLSLHIFFVARIVKGNKVDRAMAHHYLEEMRKAAGSSLPASLQERVSAHQRQVGFRSYAHVFQLGVTLVLCATAVLAVVWKAR